MPFVVALVGVVVLGALAYLYLRDDPGELVRPERLTAVGDREVRAVASDRAPCERVIRAQVDLAEEAVFLELVVERTAEECTAEAVDLEAEITLPEAIDGRDLRAGVGRYQIPCVGRAPSFTCAEDR